MRIKINMQASIISDLASFASTEETRYRLRGVCIWKHPTLPGVIACVTDGHRLVMLYDGTATAEGVGTVCGEGVILHTSGNKDLVRHCKPARGCDPANWRIEITGDEPHAGSAAVFHVAEPSDSRAFGRALIDGTFPDVSGVIPALGDCGASVDGQTTWNAQYLAAFATLAPKPKNARISVYPNNDLSGPARVLVHERPEALCVLMPARGACMLEEGATDWWDRDA